MFSRRPNQAFNADSLQWGICFANFAPHCKPLRRQAGAALPVNLALGGVSKRIMINRSITQGENHDRPLRVITTTGGENVLEEAAVNEFKTSLRGQLLTPGDAGYDDARLIHNGMHDKRPALIARCTGVADVVAAVNFARTHHLLVAVRGGGHNVAGNASCDGGIMIDLSQMKGIHVDQSRTGPGSKISSGALDMFSENRIRLGWQASAHRRRS